MMKSITLGFWRHVNFMDVAVRVNEILEQRDEFVRVHVSWYNVTLDQYIMQDQIIDIRRDQFDYWEKIKNR